MTKETLKTANAIQEDIVYLTKKLAEVTDAINSIQEDDLVITELRSSSWREKISVGKLLPGEEVLTMYQRRIKEKIKELEKQFDSL